MKENTEEKNGQAITNNEFVENVKISKYKIFTVLHNSSQTIIQTALDNCVC